MTLRHDLGTLVIAMSLVACAHRSSRSARSTDAEPPAPQTVQPLSAALIGGTEGSMVDGDSLDRLLAAPEVTAAGERLLDRLVGDPALEPLYAGFIGNLMQQPTMLEAIAAQAARNPGASIDDLSERLVTQLSEGIDGPVFDAALDASLDRLLDRPAIDAAFDRVATAVLERARVSERLATLLMQWQPEIEAAVGLPMSHEDFPARLEAHVQQPARSQRLQQLLAARLDANPRIRQGLIDLLEHDDFFGACSLLLQRLLTSTDFEANTAAIFVGMLEARDVQDMGRRIDRVLVTPEIERAVVQWAEGIIASDALTVFAQALGSAFDDPNLEAELFDVLVGASAGPTA